MSDIAVRCEGLVKTFSDAGALNGLSLDVVKGEILALIGPSGCGKTTLLRLITGVSKPDAGSIEVGGRVMGSS